MIELIFVIVIIAILSAVALPKFLESSDQAKVAKIKGYAGTLARTTLPPFWGKSIEEDNNGSIAPYDTQIQAALPAPQELTSISFASGNLESNITKGTAPSHAVATATIATTTYTVACTDGTPVSAPECNVWDGNRNRWIIKTKR
jgi:type II secretory pathway pseudopilin PulG